MTLPPIPSHPEPHTYTWTKLELADIEAYGKKCWQAATAQEREACAEIAKENYDLNTEKAISARSNDAN